MSGFAAGPLLNQDVGTQSCSSEML